jgi:hypothetical protein
MLDEETVQGLHAALEGEIGDGGFGEALRNATHSITATSMAGLKGKLSRYGVVKKRILEAIEEFSLLLGAGRIEVVKYTPGVKGEMLLRRPFDIEVVTAGVVGALEEVDHCLYNYVISDEGGETRRLTLELAGVGVREGGSDDGTTPYARAASGGEKMEVCKQCGLPSHLAELRWDEMYGTITAGPGGRRIAFIPGYMISALTRYGDASFAARCERLVEDAVYMAAGRSIRDGRADVYEGGVPPSRGAGDGGVRERLRVRGWGAVTEESTAGREWTISVLNPVDNALIAGWLRALYTVTEGREARVEIGEKPPLTLFRLA